MATNKNKKMTNSQKIKFLRHNRSRTVYVISYLPSSQIKIREIDKEDEIFISTDDSFLVNKTKRWGTKVAYIVDILVTMNGIFKLQCK